MKKLEYFFEKIIDFIFPEDKNQKFARKIKNSDLQNLSHFTEDEKRKCFALFDYKDPLIKTLIWNIKYKGCWKSTKKAAEVVYPHLIESIAEKIMFGETEKPILIPIPLSKNRLRKRGFNQSERICKQLKKIDNEKSFVLESKILKKKIDTKSQTKTKNKEERLENQRNAFEIKSPKRIENKTIILIDDVVTTGATMSEARKTLLKSDSKEIISVAIAKV